MKPITKNDKRGFKDVILPKSHESL